MSAGAVSVGEQVLRRTSSAHIVNTPQAGFATPLSGTLGGQA